MKNFLIAFSVCLVVVQVAVASVIFEDNFTVNSSNWMKMNLVGSAATISVSNGVMAVVSTGTAAAFIKHDMTLPAEYTYSVDITTSSTTYLRLGIYCNGTATVDGYSLLINANQQYQVNKFTSGTPSVLSALANSFLTVSTNTLTISKSGSTIKAFCNGKLLATCTDASYSGGFISLIVPAGVTAQFDNIIVTNTAYSVPATTCFSDNFDDGDLNGWYTARVGSQASCTGGKLVMTVGSGDDGFVYSSGAYDTASVKTIVKWTAGSDPYGLGLFDLKPITGGFDTKWMMFMIGADKTWMFYDQQGNSPYNGSWSQIHGSDTNGGIKPDTIAILYKNGNYIFSVNDDPLATIARPAGFVPEGVGMYVFANVTVSFDDLFITNTPWNNCTGILSTRPLVHAASGINLYPSSNKIYNLMGRSLVRIDGIAGFSSGKYIIANKQLKKNAGWMSIR